MKASILIAIVLLIVAACGPEHRGFDVLDSVYKIPNQDKAMLTLERDVEDHYEIKFSNAFESSKTFFVRGEVCSYNGSKPSFKGSDGKCLAGIMWNCKEMYVAIMPQDDPADYRVCGTALVHEFGHCLQILMGSGDPGHVNSEFWQIVETTNRHTCTRGW